MIPRSQNNTRFLLPGWLAFAPTRERGKHLAVSLSTHDDGATIRPASFLANEPFPLGHVKMTRFGDLAWSIVTTTLTDCLFAPIPHLSVYREMDVCTPVPASTLGVRPLEMWDEMIALRRHPPAPHNNAVRRHLLQLGVVCGLISCPFMLKDRLAFSSPLLTSVQAWCKRRLAERKRLACCTFRLSDCQAKSIPESRLCCAVQLRLHQRGSRGMQRADSTYVLTTPAQHEVHAHAHAHIHTHSGNFGAAAAALNCANCRATFILQCNNNTHSHAVGRQKIADCLTGCE